MDVELTLEERKRILKEAGLYEQGMTREQIRFCCQALSETEDAASDENISKSLNNNRHDVLNQKEDFFPKSWSSKVKVIPISSKHELINELKQNDDDSTQMETSKSELSSDNNRSIEDATKSCFGFNEMLESTENTLKLIPTKPKLIPIQWFEKFLNANNLTKAKMLYSYHTKMNNLRVQAARKSFFAAPMPPTITCDSNFNNSETKDTYVSRSGRQTKRKVYYENEDSSDGVTNVKKTKNSEEEWCGKKGDTNKIDKMRDEHDSNKMEDEVVTEDEPEKKELIPLSVEITSISNNGTAGSTTSNIKAAQTELQRKRLSEVSIEILPTTSNDQNTSTSTVECPMCGQYFPEIEIEAHAWTCSDEQPSTRSSLRSSRITKMKMICEICDSVVPFNTNYEVHVRECIKRIERESQPNR